MAQQPDQDSHVFPVDTRFQQMARRPGGVTRERALDDAQRQIDNLKTDFVDWLDRELKELAACARKVAAHPGDTAAFDRAHQASCQLRDVGGTMGFELITFVANNFCGILEAMKAGAPYDKDMIDCHIDALLLARTDPYRHLRPEQVPEMARGLRRVVLLASAAAREPSKSG